MLKHQAKGLKYYCGIGIIVCNILVSSLYNSTSAQITPDTTLPSNTTVRLQGNTQFIEGGTQAGSNLFQSFRDFSVPDNSTAHFNNGTDIQNIISRVTGGSISNITAVGKTPELTGEVQIKTPEVDALKGTIVLPVDVVDGSQLINKNFCARAYDSSFIITGRGGLSPSPYDILEDYHTTWEDWRMNPVTLSQQGREQKREQEIQNLSDSVPTPIIEAQGWVINNQGKVELVAFTPHVTPHNLQNVPIKCK